MAEKAKYAEPCSRCGACCSAELCPVAEVAFPGEHAPCPALFFSEGKEASCGMVLAERYFTDKNMIQNALGVGCGCSFPDKDTTDEQIEEHNQRSRKKILEEGK